MNSMSPFSTGGGGKRKAEALPNEAPRDSSDEDAKVHASPALESSKDDVDRPTKKPKASAAVKKAPSSSGATTQEDIAAKLSAMSKAANGPKKSSLSDYEKCSIFPQKLMQLLKNDEAPDAIWWLEDGESFAIEQEQFTKVMNKVSRTSKKKVKLDSILRNLYRWGFKKLKDRELPPNVLAYSHPNFKRNASVEMQTFSKKPEVGSAATAAEDSIDAVAQAPSALARALSARAQAGYGDNWNEEGAADKTAMAMQLHQQQLHQQQLHQQQQLMQQQQQQQQQQNPYTASMMGMGRLPSFMGSPGAIGMSSSEDERRRMLQSMMLQQQQQQQRQMMLQQELYLRNQQQQHQQQRQQRQQHQQALLYEAAAAERAAQYAAQRRGGAPPPSSGFPHFPPYPPF